MQIHEFQRLIEDIYFAKDHARGLEGTFLWFMEEVGELARALKSGSPTKRAEEFADVAAWLFTLASIVGVNMEAAATAKYAQGCPKCHCTPCACNESVQTPPSASAE